MTSTATQKLPIHRLPIPSTTLQSILPQLELDPSPVSQRRSTTFTPSTAGIWARVNPMWTAWPLRITKEELLEMGVDVDKGEQVSVADVLARWDPVNDIEDKTPSEQQNRSASAGENDAGMRRWTSAHRETLQPYLLGVSTGTLKESLPHLDAGTEEQGGSSAAEAALIDVVSGRYVLASDALAKTYGPWSTRYCGHQFGVWAGQLGDGRATSILETVSQRGGRQEIQLKGAGRTPFSRSADGLAVLRSGVREYLGCEAVAALDIPTTRSLALLTAEGIPVIRETGPEPPSLLARVAPSFIRIGHFEALNPSRSARDTRQIFFGGNWQQDEDGDKGPLGGQGNLESLRALAEWCAGLMKEMGWLVEGDGTKRFFEEVVRRNAEMVAKWQVYGYCHGVLNSDNVSILGLTIDYGPYAFMDVFDEAHICNHSDPSGLYSYRNQPSRILFALDKLYQALSPLIGFEALNGPDKPGWSDGMTKDDLETWTYKTDEVLAGWEKGFFETVRKAEQAGWQSRFGLKTYRSSDDRDIVQDFLTNLHTYSMDFHTSFRQLCHFDSVRGKEGADEAYLVEYVRRFVEAGIVARREEEVEAAKKGWVAWFKQYAARASEEAEVEAWAAASSGSLANGSSGEVSWVQHRGAGMKAVNPRFVLRQWVLEELIKDMESALMKDTPEGRQEAKSRLARILDMSSRPYDAYSEDVDSDASCPTKEAQEDRRLCGLGSRDMLGFQCSCSS